MFRGNVEAKAWMPAVGAVCLVIAATVYALSRTAEVAEGIGEMRRLASTLNDSAQSAEREALSPDEVEALRARHRELTERMRDSVKRGLVASQLSEAVRAAGLSVLEIQPIASKTRPAAGTGAVEHPHYLVSMRGSYQQIAEYMQRCARQRIPVRVVGFHLGPADDSTARRAGMLEARITVEAFHAREANGQGDTTA